jgi:hypothetical protein
MARRLLYVGPRQARRFTGKLIMKTIDAHDLAAVHGGMLAGNTLPRMPLPELPRDLSWPKLPQQPPKTIPLGPYYPPTTPNNIA